jgi:predicted GTPase
MNSTFADFLNIVIVGCVSSGKSTFLNACFGENHAQCKIKRTTMMANIFKESKDSSKNDTSAYINKKISDINCEIIKHTEQGKKLNLNDFGGELIFHVDTLDIKIGNGINICMWDIPGLNDAKTKDTYYKYLEDNFHKFNIILFVVDINSGLNTSDEIDIVNFLADNVLKHKTQSDKTISVLTVVNKVDDMQLSEINNTLEIIGELGEMYEQTVHTITDIFKNKGIRENALSCIPICGTDAHLYRMIKKYKDSYNLTQAQILKIGINDDGKKFSKYNTEEQALRVNEIIQKEGFVDDMIKLSGFSEIEKVLTQFINISGYSMVIENILLEYRQVVPITLDNLIVSLNKRTELLNQVKFYDNIKYGSEMITNAKNINTLILKKINTITTVSSIIEYYKTQIIENINSDDIVRPAMMGIWNYTKYPAYIVQKIVSLITIEFTTTHKDPSFHYNKFNYFNDLEFIGNLKIEYVDVLLTTIMNNYTEYNKIIKIDDIMNIDNIKIIFEKIKFSSKFLDFLRFFLIIPIPEIFCTSSSYLYYNVLNVKYIKRTRVIYIDIEK